VFSATPPVLPERLTIATCIGCGAMSLPAGCAGGCGPEHKLELVAGAELDDLVELVRASGRRAQALADVLTRFLALPCGEVSGELREQARAAIRAHEHGYPAVSERLTVEPEPVVSWWCEHCGGLDAPAPCVGVCIRRPAQWANLEAVRRQREAAAAGQENELRLAQAVRPLVLTRPRPGRELQHWRALRETAGRSLSAQPDAPTRAPVGPVRGCAGGSTQRD
jgi:hypothetical protein